MAEVTFELKAGANRVEIAHGDGPIIVEDAGYTTDDPGKIAQLDAHDGVKRAGVKADKAAEK